MRSIGLGPGTGEFLIALLEDDTGHTFDSPLDAMPAKATPDELAQRKSAKARPSRK